MTGKLRPRSKNACPSLATCFSLLVCLLFALNAFGQVEQGEKERKAFPEEVTVLKDKVGVYTGGPELTFEEAGIKGHNGSRLAARGTYPEEMDFSERRTYKMRGSFVMIGNGNVNIRQKIDPPVQNNDFYSYDYDYDGNDSNNWKNMGYVDLDDYNTAPNYLSSWNNTDNSSMSELLQSKLGTCAEIKYVGLYWAAMYEDGDDYNNDANDLEGKDGYLDWMNFSIPGQDYVRIDADTIIVDRDHKVDEGGYYTCYADVTNLVKSNPNGPFGEYWAANIKAFTGKTKSNGTSAMWVMVVVYENPEEPARFISVYDGFKRISSSTGKVDFGYSGFNTIPNGTVKAKFGIAALEGERSLEGDQLLIQDPSDSNDYIQLSTGDLNKKKNFFNSNITVNNKYVTTRNLTSKNTFGADIDVWDLYNNSNQLIDNDQTAVNFRLKTNSDAYAVFLNVFAVDIIQPKLQIVKSVEDESNTDITGLPVSLGQTIRYKLNVKNIGNDDAENTEIIDKLPPQVIFKDNIFTYSVGQNAGIIAKYDEASHSITFNIPDNLVKIGAEFSISFKVEVSDKCEDYVDACARTIANLASATYNGRINHTLVTDESIQGADTCGALITGATNVVLGEVFCKEARTESLCDHFILTAGDGFIAYEWTKEGHDADGDGVDDVIGTTQSINITSPGLYHVYKKADPNTGCPSVTESINVVYSYDIPNPLEGKMDDWGTCAIDGSKMGKIFLCGANASRNISTGMTSADITWQKLVDGSCSTPASLDCPSVGAGCQWEDVVSASDFNVSEEGEYRIIIKSSSGEGSICSRIFYFNVFKNPLAVTASMVPIVCGTDGTVRLLGATEDYEYSLNEVDWQDSNEFVVTTEETYTIYTRTKKGAAERCVFSDEIFVPEYTADFHLNVNQITCLGGTASIDIDTYDGQANFTYTLTDINGDVVGTQPSTTKNSHSFTGITAGTYTVTVTSNNGTCKITKDVIIDPAPEFIITAIGNPITCNPGTIDITVNTIYDLNGLNFYIIYPDGTKSDKYFESDFPIDVTASGNYTVEVVGPNGCTVSDAVTFDPYTAMSIATTPTPGACTTDLGSIEVTVTDGLPPYTYVLDGGTPTTPSKISTHKFPNVTTGLHIIKVTDASGCVITSEVPITNPTAITGTLERSVDYTCTSNAATLTVTNVSGGSGSYTYTLSGTTTLNTTGVFPAITAGTYSVTISDGNGCFIVTNEVSVEALNSPTALSFSQTAVTCTDGLTSDITVTVTGGTGPFVYEMDGNPDPNNDGIFEDVAIGTHSFTVTDAKSCSITDSYTIKPISQLSLSGDELSNVTCKGSDEGSLYVDIAGGSGNFSYTVDDGSGASAPTAISAPTTKITLSTLSAGTYTIAVTDTVLGCTDSITLEIKEPTTSLGLSLTSTPITCLANGSITATATGGWGDYDYTLTMPDLTTVVTNPDHPGVFTGLTQDGTYSVVVTDMGGNGCSVTKTIILNAPTPPTLALDAINTDFCSADADLATIHTTVTDGVGPFTYTINGGPDTDATPNDGIFENLPAGAYTITVTDSYGCSAAVSTQTIVINDQVSATAKITTLMDCVGSPDAEITLEVIGGYAPYTVEAYIGTVSAGPSFPIAAANTPYVYTAASIGSYTFVVTDDKGCTFTTAAVNVVAATVPVITGVAQTMFILCNGEATGAFEISMDPNEGTTPFEIFVNGTSYGNQTTISGLPAGIYDIEVVGQGGCSDTAQITIADPDPIAFDVVVTDLTCTASGNFSEGAITIQNVTGGTLEYTYILSGNNGFVTQTYNTTSGGENHTFNGLLFGIYTLTVSDANGCTVVQNTIKIASPPDDLDIVIDPSMTDCATGGGATVTVGTAISGGGPYYFAIYTPGMPLYPDAVYQSENPVDSESTIFTDLTPGVTYTFVVYDATTDCYYIEAAPIPIPTNATLTSTLDAVNNVSCTGSGDGSVDFTIDNYGATVTSVDYEIFHTQSNAPMSPVQDGTVAGAAPQTITDFGTLPPGEYYILFTVNGGVNNGCSVASLPFTIEESAIPLAITAVTSTNDNCAASAGTISITAQNGTGPYEYQVQPQGTPAVATDWVSTNTFNVDAGIYTAYVRDAYGCMLQEDETVGIDPVATISLAVVGQCTAANGEFIIEVTRLADGTAPYTYNVDGGIFMNVPVPETDPTFEITGLSAGTHKIIYKGVNGCPTSATVEIYEPMAAQLAITVGVTCTSGNDGEITATVTGGSGDFNYTLTGVNTGYTLTQTIPVFSGLAPDIYNLTVTDNIRTCTATAEIELIAAIDPIILNEIPTDVSCFGGSDGSVSVEMDFASLTDPVYTYELFDNLGNPIAGHPAQTNNGTFTGLLAGDYFIRITSAIGCDIDSGIITVGTPLALGINSTVTPFTCSTGTNDPMVAVITINGTGGTPLPGPGTGYTYSTDGVNYFTKETFNVPFETVAHTLTLYVKDANGCTVSQNLTIDAAIPLTDISVGLVDRITCTNDEKVTLTVTGGSGTYIFSKNGVPGTQVTATSQTYDLQTVGNYTFMVTDVKTGCTLTTSYEVKPFDKGMVNITGTTPTGCFGGKDGSLTFEVTDYTGPFGYIIIHNGIAGTPIPSNTSDGPITVDDLSAGSYQVQISETDTPFCTPISQTMTIVEPNKALSMDAQITSPLTCAGKDATITAFGYDGWGNYEYQLEDASGVLVAYQSSNTFSNLDAGAYTVRVRSSKGAASCEVAEIVTIKPIIPISLSLDGTVEEPTCNADNTGKITVKAKDGGGNYTYVLVFPSGKSSAAQTSPIFDNLRAGTYKVIVTDNLGCTADLSVTINEPAQVVANVTLTTAQTCTTEAVITVTGTQGVAPYTYSADGIAFGTTKTFTVGPGEYTYYVKDANGCISKASTQITVPVIQPLTISLDLENAVVSCHDGANAVVFVQATGALGNYEYTLYETADRNTAIQGPQKLDYFSGIPAGEYTVEVTSADCAVETVSFTVANPAEIVPIITKSNITCFGAVDGSIDITATGGTGTILYSFDQRQWFTNTDGADFKNLPAGTYTVYIQDEAGCSPQGAPFIIDILEPKSLTATGKIISQNLCATSNGMATVGVDIVGGSAPYQVSLTGKPDDYVTIAGNTATFEVPVQVQDINFFITDAGGCSITTRAITLSNPVNLAATHRVESTCENVHTLVVEVEDAFSAQKVEYSLNGGPAQTSGIFQNVPEGTHEVLITHLGTGCTNRITSIVVKNSDPVKIISVLEGELNEYTVSASGGDGHLEYQLNDGPWTNNNKFEITESGYYTIAVSISGGCMAQEEIYLEFTDVFIPNYFTPNNDGKNDYWLPQNMPYGAKAIIFDRYGRKIAEFNGTQLGWDGTYQGHELPSGDYWFWVKFNNGTDRQTKGHFTLIR